MMTWLYLDVEKKNVLYHIISAKRPENLAEKEQNWN